MGHWFESSRGSHINQEVTEKSVASFSLYGRIFDNPKTIEVKSQEITGLKSTCKENFMATITKRKNKRKSDNTQMWDVRIRQLGYNLTATFPNKTLASAWAKKTEAEISEGRYLDKQESTKHTVKDMLKRYELEVMPNKAHSTVLAQRSHITYWKDEIGNLTLAEISSALLSEHKGKLLHTKTSRGAKRAHSTVNRYMALISHALTIATKEWQWITENPALNVGNLKEDNERVRFLSEDEEVDGEVIKGERTRLLEASRASDNKALYPAVVLALSTGARRMEIMNLRWQDIDFKRGMVTLHTTKNKERRALYLTGHALELVKELRKVRRIDSDLLFPAKAKKKKEGQKVIQRITRPVDLKRSFATALKKADIEDFRWHDLRHSSASYLAMNGASLAEIAEILGHKTLQMVKRYSHISESHAHSVIEKMNKRMFGENGNG